MSHQLPSRGHTKACISATTDRRIHANSLTFSSTVSGSMVHCAGNRGTKLRPNFTVALCAWTHSRGCGCTYSPAGFIRSQRRNSSHSSQKTAGWHQDGAFASAPNGQEALL